MKNLLKQFIQLSVMPEYGSEEYKNWIKQDDFIRFLQSNTNSNQVVLSAESPYIYGVLVPENLASPPKVDVLEHWGCYTAVAWSIDVIRGDQPDVVITRILNQLGSETLRQGEQIVFTRRFRGRSYIEISQKFSHAFNIHYDAERQVFCRVKHSGDLEDVVNISNISHQSYPEGRSLVVTIVRDRLDRYLTITNQALILLYHSSRVGSQRQYQDIEYYETQPEIYYHMGQIEGVASNLCGFQVLRSRALKKDLFERYERYDFDIVDKPPRFDTGF